MKKKATNSSSFLNLHLCHLNLSLSLSFFHFTINALVPRVVSASWSLFWHTLSQFFGTLLSINAQLHDIPLTSRFSCDHHLYFHNIFPFFSIIQVWEQWVRLQRILAIYSCFTSPNIKWIIHVHALRSMIERWEFLWWMHHRKKCEISNTMLLKVFKLISLMVMMIYIVMIISLCIYSNLKLLALWCNY